MIKTVKRFKKDEKTIALVDLIDILTKQQNQSVFFLHNSGVVYQIHFVNAAFYIWPIVGCGCGIWEHPILEGDHFDLWIEARMGDGTFYVIESSEAIPGFLSMVLSRGLE